MKKTLLTILLLVIATFGTVANTSTLNINGDGTVVNGISSLTFPSTMTVSIPHSAVNVMIYGAKGDGTTDDTVAIQNAIASFPSTGGTLYFPPGIYTNRGGFFITVPINIVGDGMGTLATVTSTNIYNGPTTIVYNSTNSFLFCFTNVAVSSVRYISLINAAASPLTNASIVICNSTNYSQKVDFESTIFAGGYRGLELRSGFGWTVHNCTFINQTWESFLIDNAVNADCGDWAISDCVFVENPFPANAGIKMFGSGGGKIANSKFVGPYTNAISVRLTHGGTSNIQISNCSIEGSMWWSMDFWGTDSLESISITGCQIHAGHAQTNPNGAGGCIVFNSGVGNFSIISGNILRGCSAINPILLNNVTNVVVGANLSDSTFPMVSVNAGSKNIYTNALVKMQ